MTLHALLRLPQAPQPLEVHLIFEAARRVIQCEVDIPARQDPDWAAHVERLAGYASGLFEALR